MKKFVKVYFASAAICGLTSTLAIADATVTVDDVPVDLAFSGFVRADFGTGDRYPTAYGEERFGSSKDLLLLSATTEDIQAILDFGGTIFNDGVNNGSAGIKDAFIIIGANNKTGLSWSVGAQPLLFGLHPNGYPGDSSLQANVDYGSNRGSFAVSQQAGPAIIFNYKFTPDLSVRFGAFDLAASNATNVTTATNGSKIKDNLFILGRGDNLGGTGLYATVGAERIYVGASGTPIGGAGYAVDDSKTIYSAGVGWKNDFIDASVEYIHLAAAIVDEESDERYIRAHVAVSPAPQWTIYADYSNGHELGVSDYRVGAFWQFRKHLRFTAEYSKDVYTSTNELYNDSSYNGSPVTSANYGLPQPANAESVDLRATFTF
jgi:hypothetical protein